MKELVDSATRKVIVRAQAYAYVFSGAQYVCGREWNGCVRSSKGAQGWETRVEADLLD